MPKPLPFPRPASPAPDGAGDLATLFREYTRALAARGRTEKTRRAYAGGFTAFLRSLDRANLPAHASAVTPAQAQEFVAETVRTRSPATAQIYAVSLKLFFAWLVEEGELLASPFARVRRPAVPEAPAPVLADAQVRRLIRACEGTAFTDRRDLAIVRLLLDTGMRRGELLGLRLEDVDPDQGILAVVGKGRRRRLCRYGAKAGLALDRYRRARARHLFAADPALWLGRQGPLREGGLVSALRRRAELAGIAGFHPHLLRHYFAHAFLQGGGQERDLMILGGWKSATVARRYAASNAEARALEAHKRFGPGDRL